MVELAPGVRIFTRDETDKDNLVQESVDPKNISVVGDLANVAEHLSIEARQSKTIVADHGLEGTDYTFVAIHQKENTDDPARMELHTAYVKNLLDQGKTVVCTSDLEGRLQNHPHLKIINTSSRAEQAQLIAKADTVYSDIVGHQKMAASIHGATIIVPRFDTEWLRQNSAGLTYADQVAFVDPSQFDDTASYIVAVNQASVALRAKNIEERVVPVPDTAIRITAQILNFKDSAAPRPTNPTKD